MEDVIMNNEAERVVAPTKKPYATWDVGGQEYKLKLTTDVIEKLESKYNKNLLLLIDDGIPTLTTLLTLVHGGLQKYHHGIKLVDVKTIYEEYVENGGNQLDLLTSVIMPMYEVSGFFPPTTSEELTEVMETLEVTTTL